MDIVQVCAAHSLQSSRESAHNATMYHQVFSEEAVVMITIFLLTPMTCSPFLVNAQQQSKINAVVVLDADDEFVQRGVEGAFQYITSEIPGINVEEVARVIIDPSDPASAENDFCSKTEGLSVDFVFDATKSSAGVWLKSFVRNVGLPTVSTTSGYSEDLQGWQNLTLEEQEFLVQIRPPGDVMVSAIRSFALQFSLNSAAILHDQSFAMQHQYVNLLRNVPIRHIIQKVEVNVNELGRQVNRLKDTDVANFFLAVNTENQKRVMEEAQKEQMYGRNYAWYILKKDLADPLVPCNNCTILLLRPKILNETNFRIVQEMFDFQNESIIDTVFHFDVVVASFKAIHNLKITGKWPDLSRVRCTEDLPSQSEAPNVDLRMAIAQVQHFGSFGQISAEENGIGTIKLQLDVLKMTFYKGRKQKTTKEGVWESGDDKAMKLKTGLQDFLPITIYKVTTVVKPPFVYKKPLPDGSFKFSGFCIDLLDALSKILKFHYEIFENEDKSYGTLLDNNTWNGIVGDLFNKRAHIAMATLYVNAERESIVDFTIPYYDLVGIRILMLKPRPETSLFKFLSVMEADVWGCILGAYFFTSFLLWLVDRYSPFSYQNNKEKYESDPEKREFTLKESLWFCITSLTPQGGGDAPKNISGRLVAATWWLFSFIVIASYTANLAAFLTVSRLDTPVDSITSLADQYKVQYAPVSGTSVMQYFQRMANIESRFFDIWKDISLNDNLSSSEREQLSVWDYPVSDKYTKIWQSIQEAGMPLSLKDGISRLRNSSGNFALIADSSEVKYAVLTNCDLMAVGEEFSRKPYGIAVQKGSPLKEQLSLGILQLQNQRDLERFKETWWTRNPDKVKCDEFNEQSDGVSISNIGGVFIVICVGIALAAFTLLAEYWWYRIYKRDTFVRPISSKLHPAIKKVQAIQVPTKKDPRVFNHPRLQTLTKRHYYFKT